MTTLLPVQTLTPEERTAFDAAVLAIPSSMAPLFDALSYANLAQRRHDWNQLHNVIGGYQQLLDVRYDQEATERLELSERITNLSAMVKTSIADHTAQVTMIETTIDGILRRLRALEAWRRRNEKASSDDFDDPGQGGPQ